jgi:TPR repeat protein
MKKTLLFVLALAVIPVGVDAQVTPLASCADLSLESDRGPWLDYPLEDLRTCAEQGNAVAQFSLGVMYAYGDGVPQDDVDAQLALGYMYSAGEGVPEDFVLAYMWYDIAAAGGGEGAQSSKEILESYMTREQIAEGQRMSTEWLAAHPPGGN